MPSRQQTSRIAAAKVLADEDAVAAPALRLRTTAAARRQRGTAVRN